MFDYLKCEYELPLTEEIKEELPQQDWAEVNFQTKSLDCAMDEISIEDDGQIYIKQYKRYFDEKGQMVEKDTGIEKMDWSGELRFYFDFVKDEYDIWLEFKALVWKGELKEIELLSYQKIDNEHRIELQQEIEKKLKESEAKKETWWWKPFKIWCSIVRIPLFVARWSLGLLVRLTWKIERWLTGNTLRF